MPRTLSRSLSRKASARLSALQHHISISGSAVRIVCLQSIPSSSIDSCTAVNDTRPFGACGLNEDLREQVYAWIGADAIDHLDALLVRAREALGKPLAIEAPLTDELKKRLELEATKEDEGGT